MPVKDSKEVSGGYSLPPRPCPASNNSANNRTRRTAESMNSMRRRSSTRHLGGQEVAGHRDRQSAEISGMEDNLDIVQFRRSKSLDNPMHVKQRPEGRPTARRIRSVECSFVNAQEAGNKHCSRRRVKGFSKNSDSLRQQSTGEEIESALHETILQKNDRNTARIPRRSQSLKEGRSLSRSLSKGKQLNPASSAAVNEEEIGDRDESMLPSRRRILRRSQPSACPSVTSTTGASSESSSSSGTSGGKKQSGNRKRSSSLRKQNLQRVKGDQAPVTPTRGPPSPTYSDSSLSPPQAKQDSARIPSPPTIKAAEDLSSGSVVQKPIVSLSKVKRNPKKPRSKRLLQSNSCWVTKSTDMTGAVTSSPTDSDQLSSASSEDVGEASAASSLSSNISPPLVTRYETSDNGKNSGLSQSFHESKTQQGRNKSNTIPGKKRRTYRLSRLTRSFSLGSRKQASSKLNSHKGSPREHSKNKKLPSKDVVDPARSTDESTSHSGTERTVSTISTSHSDLSSNSGGYDRLSPVQSSVTRIPPVANYQNFSRLLSRLRTDFDLPVEEDYGEDAVVVRRPASMSSLTSHLEQTRTRIVVGKDSEEADEDSTMVSNMDVVGNVKTPSERSRSSLSKRRKSREKNSTSKGRGVNFGNVCVREYERIVGDNPAVSSGVPIGLGWNYSNYLEVGVEIYEASVRKPGPRNRRDFFLTPQNRIHILRDECGCASEDITKAKELAAEVRSQRQASIFGEPVQLPRSSQPASSRGVEQPSKRPQKPANNRAKVTGSVRLLEPPKEDNRWDTSCPAAPAVGSTQ